MRQNTVVSTRYYGTFYAEITVANTYEVHRGHTAEHIRYLECPPFLRADTAPNFTELLAHKESIFSLADWLG